MKTPNLPDRLKRLAKEIKQHEDLLNNTAAIREISRFLGHLNRFESFIETAIDPGDPDLPLLKELLASPAARRHLDEPTLRRLHREVIGKGPPLPKDASKKKLRDAFLSAAIQGRYCAKAVAALRILYSRAAAASTSTNDEAALILELYRLGGLTDIELAEERRTRLAKPGWIDKLAAAAQLRIPASATIARKTEAVIRFAKRARANLD